MYIYIVWNKERCSWKLNRLKVLIKYSEVWFEWWIYYLDLFNCIFIIFLFCVYECLVFVYVGVLYVCLMFR